MMWFKFGAMFGEVMQELTIAVKLDRIKELLGFWNPDLKTELATVQKVEALIKIIRDNCSFTNYSILTKLAQQLHNDSALTKIKAYTEKRNEYYGRVLAKDFARVTRKQAQFVPSGHIMVIHSLIQLLMCKYGHCFAYV